MNSQINVVDRAKWLRLPVVSAGAEHLVMGYLVGAQCINYLAATKFPLCLLINFKKKVEIKRIVGPAFNAGLLSD